MREGRGERGERCMKMGEIEEALVYTKARKRHLSILRSPFSSLPPPFYHTEVNRR
jgi:hypothetical protein